MLQQNEILLNTAISIMQAEALESPNRTTVTQQEGTHKTRDGLKQELTVTPSPKPSFVYNFS